MEHRAVPSSLTAGLRRYPARPAAPVPRCAPWTVGLLVALALTVAGALLGPVVAVVAFDLAPLHPVVLLLGLTAGAAYGLAVGVLVGAATTLTLALARAHSSATARPTRQ